jgi:hypothetical protein
VFVDLREALREAKLSVEHEASGDLSIGPAGYDAVLLGTEVVGSTRTGSDEHLETSEALTQAWGDAEIRRITSPDDVPEPIMSVEESDPSFANLDGRSGEERVMTGEEGIGIRGLVSDSRYGLGPARASAPTLEDRVRQGRPTKRAVDIPALMEVSFPGLGPVEEPRVMNGHTRRQLLAANNVGSGQRLDDCRSPSRDCPNCGAKGEKTHNKDTCPARNKVCFSCGIQGHYGRMCGKKKGLALVKGMYAPEKLQRKKASAHERCPWCGTMGAKIHLRDACPAQGKDCFNCGMEGHFGRVCMMRKEAPVGNADTGRTPRETLDSKCDIQPRLGEEVQGVSSTGVWSPSGSRIWRPSVVVDQLPTLKLTGAHCSSLTSEQDWMLYKRLYI